MFKNFSSFALASIIVLFNSAISAGIIETNEMATIQPSVTEDSLVLLNVTGTLYQPATTLADRQWRNHFEERVNALISNKQIAERMINKVKNEIVNYIPKKPVEEFTPQYIVQLQEQKIPVLGITQKQMATPYAENFGLITRNHLLNIGIVLENTLSYLKTKGEDDANHSFAYGILFTNKKPVGPAILSFLERLENKPAKVIMVDNSLRSLQDAEEALLKTTIAFEGFRYGRSDILIINFDPIIGDIQFLAFVKQKEILSDEQAKQIKQANPDVDYSSLLDHYILEKAI